MAVILAALAPVFLIMALGAILQRTKVAGNDVWRAIDHLAFYVLFPALLVTTLVRADLGNVAARAFLGATLGATVIVAALLMTLFLLRRHTVNGPAFTSVFQGSVRYQSMIAVALAGALFGQPGLTFIALSIASMVPLVQLMCVLVLLYFGENSRGASVKSILRGLALNPLVVACLVGLVLNRLGLPTFAIETLAILGNGSIGLVLLSVGAGLNLSEARAAGPLVAASMAMKLIAMPMLVLGLAPLMGLSGLGLSVAVIAASVPTAATSYTLARKMGGNAELMAQIITFQTLASAFTLPVFLYLAS